MTVLQIASLKKVKKGTKIMLLDKNGSGAKDIAKALTSRGYKRVFVISGGFGGWTASKLKTRGSSTVRIKPPCHLHFPSTWHGSPKTSLLKACNETFKTWWRHLVQCHPLQCWGCWCC